MKEAIISRAVQEISEKIGKLNYVSQIYIEGIGLDEEDRKSISTMLLKQHRIETIRVSEYADLYVKSGMSDEEKAELVKQLKPDIEYAYHDIMATRVHNDMMEAVDELVSSLMAAALSSLIMDSICSRRHSLFPFDLSFGFRDFDDSTDE